MLSCDTKQDNHKAIINTFWDMGGLSSRQGIYNSLQVFINDWFTIFVIRKQVQAALGYLLLQGVAQQ